MAVQVNEHGSMGTAESASALLRVRVSKMFPAGRDDDGQFLVSAEFQAEAGITVILGPSGSGKTTLLDCIAGVTRPEEGRIAVGERVLFDSSANVDLSPARRHVGYVFQTLALFPHLTAQQNVEYGIEHLALAERRRRSDAMLEAMRILALRARKPRDISGGERQRVALARALVTEPSVLLLDEPLAALDVPTKSRIIDDLRTWNERQRIPILYVTHSREEVFALANRVVVLEAGSIVAEGSPYEVLERPRHETVAQWAGFENVFDARVVADHEQRGTTTVAAGRVQLEIPLVGEGECPVRLGIRAGDILLATQEPVGISARNVIRGKIVSLTRRDTMVVAQVECGVKFEVHVTPHASEALGLHEGAHVWLIIKTHSCHVLRK